MQRPIWIDEHEVVVFHDRLLALHGGAAGIRDEGLLKSALARARQHATYTQPLDIVFLAAIYTTAIVKNHPFIDGNKRTGFLIGILFLELNGYRFTASQEDAANVVLALASSSMDEISYAAFLRTNSKPT